jgi:carboxymethylenebutenolidase
MTPEEMKRVHDEHLAAEAAKDLERAMATYVDDCFYDIVPMGIRIDGKEAVRGYYQSLFNAMPDSDLEVAGEAFGDNVLVAWGTFHATILGDFMGLPPTNRKLALPMTVVNEFKDGRMLAEHLYYDLITLTDQAGISIDHLRTVMRPVATAPAS